MPDRFSASVAALLLGAASALAQDFAPPPLRPIAQPVETATPRITGNSFLHLWRAEDFGGGAGNTGVLQHPDTGFIYVGNSQGVLEYDGSRWQLVPLPHGGAVLALAIDEHGRVWAAGDNEIARLDLDANGALQATSVLYPLPDGESGAITSALAAGGAVWFGGQQHVLRIAAEGEVETWRTGERFGRIWWMEDAVHTRVSDREVVRLEPGGGLKVVVSRETQRMPPPHRPSPFRVFDARQTGDGEWVLLTALGPMRYRRDANIWRPFPMRPPLFREAEAVAATFLEDGAMVFATTRPGGFVITPEGRIERMLDRLPAVLNPRVTHLAADREGGLWVTSRDNIARLQLRSAFARHEGAQGMQGGPRQLLRHRDTLFVAHTLGVSWRTPWPGNFPPVEGIDRGVESMAIVGERVFVAATGLFELTDDGGAARPLNNLAITTLTGLRNVPHAVLGGNTSGTWWFRPDGAGAWEAVGRLTNLDASIGSLFECGDGWLWGATTNGRIWRADLRDGLRLDAPVTHYGPERGVPAVERAGRVRFFRLGADTFATCPGWLLRHDAATDRFVPERRIPGLNTPERLGAEAVGVNADGSCWLRLAAPDRRLLRVSIDRAQRWQAEELRAPMISGVPAQHLLEHERTLWVAGHDLLVSIDLDWKPEQPLPPLAARVRRVVFPDGEAPFVVSQSGASILQPEQNSLRFEFTAASFIADHRGRPIVRYRTQLEGLERGWTTWSAEPWRDFTNLPAGRYTFRLQATDQAERTSAVSSLALVITQPWWRMPWAWAGYASLAGIVLVGGVRLRTRALRRRAERLEETIAARTEELRRSNAELARLHQLELDATRRAEEQARLELLRYQLNPHFLYNTLNSIYSLVLTAPPAAANMVLRLADFCRVALDRRHEEYTTVAAEFDKLANYLEIEKIRWGDSLRVSVEADETARRAALPPFLLLPLVENAIKYGGATSPDELHVRVTAQIDGDDVVIAVANTGTWIDRTQTTPSATSSGIGLANLRQRLQRYHPDAHDVTIDEQGGWVVVTLRLPAAGERLAGSSQSAIRDPQ